MAISRQGIGTLMSGAVIHNGTVYLQGLTPEDATADIQGQTRQVLDRIDARRLRCTVQRRGQQGQHLQGQRAAARRRQPQLPGQAQQDVSTKV